MKKAMSKMLLNQAKIGKVYQVTAINGKSETVQYLANIGCFVDGKIMISSKVAANFVIEVLNTKFGIDANIARLIEVELCE